MSQRQGAAKVAEPKSVGFVAIVLRPPTFGGLIGALVFYWFSLEPSLLPRWWVMQPVISGLGAAIGYLVGTTIDAVVRALMRRSDNTVSPKMRRGAWTVLAAAGLLAVGVGLVRWPLVQNESRDLVDLAHVSFAIVVPIALASVVVFVLVLAIARLFFYIVRRLEAFAQRFVPRSIAWLITLAIVTAGVVIFSVDVVEKEFISFTDQRFGVADRGTAADVQEPTSDNFSGSPIR